VLDPLAAVMLVMVSLVGLLIFTYSLAYMAQDENFTTVLLLSFALCRRDARLVIANSFLLLFICWELVGLASYLLIGFWYHKPAAAAAAKKAVKLASEFYNTAMTGGVIPSRSQKGVSPHIYDSAKNKAAIEFMKKSGFRPDIIHCNDWQTALVLAYLKDTGIERVGSMFTIHNLAYQAPSMPHCGHCFSCPKGFPVWSMSIF
jgi:NADH:ubiquinone oxidoreductase subunit 5 (subunit L)/multisubunit Na+/H+ antiporter MnhA subunit